MDYKTEEVVNTLVSMRLSDMASVKTCLEYLKELGYKQTYSYQLMKYAAEKIKEYYTDMHTNALEESMGQMESLAEDAKKNKNYKLAFEVRKEMNDIMGLNETKINLSGNINLNTEIRIIFPGGQSDE